ncbi:hypothetical protein PHYPSEUDO_013324 [Phytophthora pseudosyringae]|uniref:GAF domain-containing protein n=1 Tax=Phytophthora pseudosyringae TaxID=221518 RepID=A0A8T1W3X1_9STRA|nr:hypothetical protein PHYPSEUDO_013324 [Phytophthora pseudosyringae]
MGLTKMHNMLKERRGRDHVDSPHAKPTTNKNDLSPAPPLSTHGSNEFEAEPDTAKLYKTPSDDELLKRARDAHTRADFPSLAVGPEASGEWKRVEASDHFAVFRRQVSMSNNGTQRHGLEVMCTGRLDASLEELASILRSSSEAEHNTVMSGLYAKSFIFGSYEREVSCSENQQEDEDEDDAVADSNELLTVMTKSFARTTILGHNEQWCYLDYFQRKKESGGFTISKRALSPLEATPGRIVGENARVDQLHGLNASYLVDEIPDEKVLRVVFHAWFELSEEDMRELYSSKRKGSRRKSNENARSAASTSSSSSQRSKSFDNGDATSHKAQLRRLLTMARAVTKLPDLVRRRRFGVQVPADFNAVHVSNTRCPCCTRSLGPVKLSLAMAASAISNRSLGSLKSNTKRCYLCGYLVCVDCWNAENMECTAGRVAAIVVCTRCHANVQACEYAEVFAGTAAEREKHRGPPRVVEDASDAPTVSLLVDFLSTSLLNSPAGSSERAAVMAVIRTLLRQNLDEYDDESEDDDSDRSSGSSEYEREEPRFKILGETEAVERVGKILSDEQHLPPLEECKLGNAGGRNYVLDLPDDPIAGVPRSPIPSNEADRLASANASGLLQLADRLAPENKEADATGDKPDTQDLQLLCRLAVKTLGCAYSFVTVMSEKHEHILAGTHSDFVGAAVPREQTSCQHALMSPHPFMAAHHEADVRFHNHGSVSHIPVRFYVGFPVKLPTVGGQTGDPEMTVGMLCCIDSKPRAEISRTQYATMNRLASTAKSFLLQKSQRLQLEQAALVQS